MRYLLFIIIGIYITSCAKVPVGSSGQLADGITNKLLLATQQSHWKDTKVIQWTFDNNHTHIWDRDRNYLIVKWDEIEVYMSLDTKKGVVKENNIVLEGDRKHKLLEDAYHYWENDSYWLNPFWKFFQEGVERKHVAGKKNDALLITHTSGGNTPGDSYLWLLDQQGLPYAWKLWVSIIPFKGYKFTWEEWVTLSTGLKVSTFHKSWAKKIELSNVKGANAITELYPNDDPFKILEK